MEDLGGKKPFRHLLYYFFRFLAPSPEEIYITQTSLIYIYIIYIYL